ncbi:MAG: ATP-binding protein [Deltaproteobacteria bacterium]|nr:ATP-binding protein [Deltaproteobacteria bacterium]
MSLQSRVFAGFLVLLLVFGAASAFSVQALHGVRGDLVVLTRGYLQLGRAATQLRTLQELKDATVDRALDEDDALLRRPLLAFSRELYPEAMGEKLREIQRLARELQGSRVTTSDTLFLETVFAQARRAADLAAAYDDATARLLDSLEADADAMSRASLVDDWRKRRDQYSRELRLIALNVDNRAADALAQVERAEKRSEAFVVAVAFAAALIGFLVLAMMIRALRPLRTLVTATQALQQGASAAVVDDVVAVISAAGQDDEVAVLARELVTLARALAEREGSLAQRSQELLRLSAFAENVIRSVRVGIVVVDEQGRIRTLNPAARSVFALPLQDVEQRSLKDVVDEALLPALPLVDEVRATGALRALPLLAVKDKVVDVVIVPLRDRAGSSAGEVLLLGEDVTAREEARGKLVQSERLAAIGRLAAQITHEIRNPLSSIGLNIELLGDDVVHLPLERRAEVKSILDAVLSEVRRLAEITEGYLRYARLPAPQKQEKDAGDLCADLVAFFANEASQKGVNVELHVQDALPKISVDADRLRQALLNLLRNGVEACGRGGTVRISARRDDDVDDGPPGVKIVVEDNGPGVPAELRDKLFSPFFTTKKEGTGLGLLLTREIVREQKGDVVVDEGALGGAAFVVSLPAA